MLPLLISKIDSISRKILWPILQKQGIRGKLFRCVKSMYDVVKARVCDGASLTDSIHCLPGVMGRHSRHGQHSLFTWCDGASLTARTAFIVYLV